MYSPPPDLTVCGSCLKTQSQLANPLKRCAKCRLQFYCSRECQKSDWKSHKKTCGSTRAEPTSTFDAASSTGYQNNPQAICYIPKPFTALDNGTWLYNRPKKDVYKLLVDTYRMRLEDEYVFQGDVDEDSLYSGASVESALRHFKRFLTKTIKLDAARKKKLLPEWWSKDSLQECMNFAKTDDFSNVGLAAEKHDIQKHYCQQDMPMQLRMFSEKIDGTLAAGMSGAEMLALRVAVEKQNLSATHLSL
ncbi:hypothetical protein HA402_014958 [Bradysia odoriphaga]|nr:hypothetical protein HA402_014958 [Bradysia odoriphaga]